LLRCFGRARTPGGRDMPRQNAPLALYPRITRPGNGEASRAAIEPAYARKAPRHTRAGKSAARIRRGSFSPYAV